MRVKIFPIIFDSTQGKYFILHAHFSMESIQNQQKIAHIKIIVDS